MYFYFFGKGPCEIEPKLRLALLTLLKLQPDSLGILAPVCSSMGFLASSVTLRNCMLPLGDTSKMSVAQGNLMACRWLGSLGETHLYNMSCLLNSMSMLVIPMLERQ